MISDKRPIQQLTRLLQEHGVQHAVLCPGSRNAPINYSLSEHLTCHAITDERSAGFFALGLTRATHQPVCVVVTSGSALVNLHPAVCEAFYQQLPLIVVSADRPRQWIGQMDGQTMPQPGVFGSMVKMSVDLDNADEWFNNRLINEALLEVHHHTTGPVHINVPLSEPLYEFHAHHLPAERVIRRTEGLYEEQRAALYALLCRHRRPLIIVGQSATALDVSEQTPFCTILAEHLGNCQGARLLNDECMDRLEALEADLAPDLVVTLGGHLINKRLKRWLRALGKDTFCPNNTPATVPTLQHWHVSADGSVADLFGCLTQVIEAPIERFLHFLSTALPTADCQKLMPDEDSTDNAPAAQVLAQSSSPEAQVVGTLMAQLPEHAVLHLANSSSVRIAQCFSRPDNIDVCCNRGINGIEGCLSTAVGAATATPHRLHLIVIGDLAFHYDINALWNDLLPPNLHILLLNNHGGRIFNTLPMPNDERAQRFIAGSAHPFSAATLCQHFDIRYFSLELPLCHNLDTIIHDFLSCQTCCLLEVLS